MDYESVVELVDEMPLDDKRRLAKHLDGVLTDAAQHQAHHDRVRRALAGFLTRYELADDDPALAMSDDDAERLLDALHRETAGAEPLSAAVIEDRERP